MSSVGVPRTQSATDLACSCVKAQFFHGVAIVKVGCQGRIKSCLRKASLVYRARRALRLKGENSMEQQGEVSGPPKFEGVTVNLGTQQIQ